MRFFFLIGFTTLLASSDPFEPVVSNEELENLFDESLDAIFDSLVVDPNRESFRDEAIEWLRNGFYGVVEDTNSDDTGGNEEKKKTKRKRGGSRAASKYTSDQRELIRQLASQRHSRHRSELYAEARDIWEKQKAVPMVEESFYRFLNSCTGPRGSQENGVRNTSKRKRYCRKKPALTGDETPDTTNI